MPTARNGEDSSQAFILYCSGVKHWSKPKPVKSPGVTGFGPSEKAGWARPQGQAESKRHSGDKGADKRHGGGAPAWLGEGSRLVATSTVIPSVT